MTKEGLQMKQWLKRVYKSLKAKESTSIFSGDGGTAKVAYDSKILISSYQMQHLRL